MPRSIKIVSCYTLPLELCLNYAVRLITNQTKDSLAVSSAANDAHLATPE